MSLFPVVPTLNGQKVTVGWLMNNPLFIYRIMNTIAQQRLIGDKLLAGRVDLTGSGSAVFGVSEGIFATKSAEKVPAGGEYLLTDDSDGIPALAVTDKWGLATEIPQELVSRNRLDIVQRKIIKLVNRQVFGFDALVLSAVSSAITNTQAASVAWNNSAADPFLDMMLGGAVVDSLNLGYDVNVVALSPTYFARAVAAAKIIDRMPREGNDTLVVTGRTITIAGLTFLKSTNLPAGVNVMPVDSTALGSIASENLGGDGWVGDSASGVEVKVEPLDGRDGFRIRTRKVAVPMVQEPGAGVKITGA